MKLDQIEARLQALIESSVALFARGDAQHRLAHQLIEAAQQNLQSTPEGREVAPNTYIIFLHPDSLEYWTEHRSLVDAIGNNLRDVAREADVYFTRDPQIRLQPDPLLPTDGIRVEAGEEFDPPGHTAVFAAIPAIPHNAIPRNAFLIVEGNRILPLTTPVINIGRRSDNNIVLADPRVSRTHAQIRAIRGQYVVFDLNSTGGTIVNGRRIHQCVLKPGDVITLSGVPLIYGEEDPEDDSYEMGATRSMNTPKTDPPEVIE